MHQLTLFGRLKLEYGIQFEDALHFAFSLPSNLVKSIFQISRVVHTQRFHHITE